MSTWFHRLLIEDLPPNLAEVLPAFVKAEAREFTQNTLNQVPEAQKPWLANWYHSREGQEQLIRLFQLTWAQMCSVADGAMPAHDARHAMFKVPATALEYIVAEQVPDFERVGIFGALLHDHGRWAEERIFGSPGESVVHARLSFLLARELCAQVELPLPVQNQILHAVLQHTTGADPSSPMPAKLTVAGDRDQLYGPEIILRLLHHPVKDQELASIYGSSSTGSVVNRLFHFMGNRLPGPLFSRQSHVESLQLTLAQFLLLCETPEESRMRFEGAKSQRNPLADLDWADLWQKTKNIDTGVTDPVKALRKLLNAPNTAPNPLHVERAVERVSSVPVEQHRRLANAIAWADKQRIAEDKRQETALRCMVQDYADDIVLATVARTLLEGWNGS